MVNICTARFNIKRFYALNGVCINVFCMDVRAEIGYLLCSINGWFSSRDGVFTAPKELNILGINSG